MPKTLPKTLHKCRIKREPKCLPGVAPGLVAITLLAASAAEAQNAGAGGAGYSLFGAPAYTSGMFDAARPPDHGFTVGDWIVDPEIFAGLVFNDNLYRTSGARQSGVGLRIRPAFLAERNGGLSKTTITAYGDIQRYDWNGHAGAGANAAYGALRIVHTYQPLRDLVFRLEGGVSHSRDAFDLNGGALNGWQTLPGQFNPSFLPQSSTNFLASVSAQKEFGNLFVGVGFSAQRTTYSGGAGLVIPGLSASAENYNQYTLSGRLGYHFGPDFYAFADAATNWRSHDTGNFNSRGSRLLAGIGAERFSLFAGELYAGYSAQDYRDARGQNTSGGVFGGRVSWFPTRALSFTAQLDQQLSDGTPQSAFGAVRSASGKTTTASLSAIYNVTSYWSILAKVGYAQSRYSDSTRPDHRVFAGLSANYTFWRNWSVTADYQFSRLKSNFAGASFKQNVTSLGVTYRF